MIATMATTTAGAIDRLIATIIDKAGPTYSGLVHLRIKAGLGSLVAFPLFKQTTH